ncbi:MAG: TonB-dependent receptor [Ignavibacteriales bacterium]|nr:TonB-dependent receptor [Ignavibacteriales bacterium]
MKKIITYSILFLACFSTALSQTGTGSISGKVTDAETQNPLAGANVIIKGTFLGAVTNTHGEFKIYKVPVGTYTIEASLIGYQRKLFSGIIIKQGEEYSLSLQLLPAEIQEKEIVVTASRREQGLQEVPVSVSTVTAKTIAERNNITLDDALRYVPGVNLMQDQINIRGSTGYSRGVGSRVLLLLDGLPFITGDTGEINWEAIPTHQVERIEVVKGAGSALYGSSALGGVVNVITKDFSQSPELRFRLFSSLYDKPRYAEWQWTDKPRFNSGAMLTYSDKSGPLGYLVSVGRTVDESYRQNDTYHRWSLYSKLKYDLSTSQNLTISANFVRRTHGNFFWWRDLREATRPADSQLNGNVESNRGNIGFHYKEFVSDKFIYSVKGIYFGNFWRDDSAGNVNNVSASHLFNFEGQATYEIAKSNILTFGVAGNYDKVNANLFGSHPGVGGAVYVQDELELTSQLRLTAGLRFDMQKVSSLPSVAQLNPKLGIVYKLDNETSLRASFGSGFRYPGISELYITSSTNVSQVVVLPNTDLAVEHSISYEIGAGSSITPSVFVDAAIFSNSFDNLIEPLVQIKRYKPDPTSTREVEGPVIQFENVTKARIQGAEVGVKIDWWKKHLSSDVGYTYTWPEDLTEQTILKFRPRHILYASGALTFGNFKSSADVRYVSRIERIDENLVRLAPIIDGEQRVPIKVVDLRFSYDLIDEGLPVRVGFNINNLLNYHYVELIGNLAPVRSFTLTLDGIW